MSVQYVNVCHVLAWKAMFEPNMLLTRKCGDFIKIKDQLIHKKRVTHLHSTLLVSCYEGDGLADHGDEDC